jgi:hypothetical protein
MARGFFGAIIRVLAFCLLSYLLGRGVAILLSSGSVTISSAASPSSVASTANASSPSALPGPSAVLVGKAPIVTTLPAATTSTSTSTTTTTRTTPKVFANDAGVVFSLSPESSASNRVCEIFTSIRNALPSRFPVTVLWPSESFQGFSMCGPQESKGFDTWSVVHQTRDEHSSKYTRGATDIAHATRMISCLKVAPIDWQLVIWLNVTALENASPQVPPPCVLADTESLASLLEVVKDNFGASASMNATALGDSGCCSGHPAPTGALLPYATGSTLSRSFVPLRRLLLHFRGFRHLRRCTGGMLCATPFLLYNSGMLSQRRFYATLIRSSPCPMVRGGKQLLQVPGQA